MRRPSPYRDSQERLDVKMTPMIDVIFLLLVFFVATASFRAIGEVLPTRFTLPGTVSSQVQIDPEIVDLDEIVIDVLWRGDQPRWEVVGVEYGSLAELGAVLRRTREIKSDLPVILDVIRRAGPCRTVTDLFSGTSRVGHALKAAGYRVFANDHNAYAATLARCYVQADAPRVQQAAGAGRLFHRDVLRPLPLLPAEEWTAYRCDP